MPELPKVSQDFEASVAPYVTAIEEAIAANQKFINSIQDAITKVGELEAAMAALHDKEITVTVKYVTDGQPEKFQEAVQVVQNVQVPGGAAGEALVNQAAAAVRTPTRRSNCSVS